MTIQRSLIQIQQLIWSTSQQSKQILNSPVSQQFAIDRATYK